MTSKLLVPVCVMAACLVVFSVAHAANVTVPNVVGLPGLDANKAIQKVGLNPQYSMQATPTSDKTKADTIVKQDPAPGRSVPAGSVVTLYVYMYQPATQTPAQPQQPQVKPQPQPIQVKVPDVVGKKNTEAYKLLESAGLHNAEGIGAVATPDRSKLYTVARQDPAAGQYAKPGQVVVLVVYNVVSAPQNAEVKATIPNVYRMDAAQAKQMFANLGFKKISLQNIRTNIQGDNGKVTGQWPAPGISFSTAQEIVIQIGVYGK